MTDPTIDWDAIEELAFECLERRAAAAELGDVYAGEQDIDYLMFGAPGDPTSPDAILERTRWWAEIFNVPCVAFARSLEEIEPLADAGAEFIALEAAVWDNPRGPAAAVSEATARSAGALA